ncbi:hypothetical protein [Anatilimnocola floriformis]|uniref:hypothetical protein n=1 Tax=Anatilimnocola floriformis TaxID=2948575 RepID=UPI0020C5A545|nr:hypothetical protein [Anatilimnocola floriformis]
MWILDNEYNPFLLAFFGCVVCLGAFVAWISTGRKEALYATAGFVIFFIGLIIAERLMISDREAIQEALVKIARNLKANHRDAVYASIHPKATALDEQARAELPNYTFEDCRITQIIETKVDSAAKPKTAVTEFYVAAKGSFNYQGQPYTGAPRRIIRLTLEQDTDGKWKIINYTHRAPLEADDFSGKNSGFPGSN